MKEASAGGADLGARRRRTGSKRYLHGRDFETVRTRGRVARLTDGHALPFTAGRITVPTRDAEGNIVRPETPQGVVNSPHTLANG